MEDSEASRQQNPTLYSSNTGSRFSTTSDRTLETAVNPLTLIESFAMDVRSNLSSYASNALSVAQRYKLTLLTIVALPLIRLAYIDYRDWIALGRGGIPNNVFGWTIQCILRLIADRDVRSTGCYESLKTSDLERKGFLESDISKRANPRTGAWVVPHRQLEATASEPLKQVG